MKKQITGKPDQTIFDIALEQYGDLMGLKTLIEDNEDILQSEDMEDVKLKVRPDEPVNQVVKEYFANKSIVTY